MAGSLPQEHSGPCRPLLLILADHGHITHAIVVGRHTTLSRLQQSTSRACRSWQVYFWTKEHQAVPLGCAPLHASAAEPLQELGRLVPSPFAQTHANSQLLATCTSQSCSTLEKPSCPALCMRRRIWTFGRLHCGSCSLRCCVVVQIRRSLSVCSRPSRRPTLLVMTECYSLWRIPGQQLTRIDRSRPSESSSAAGTTCWSASQPKGS